MVFQGSEVPSTSRQTIPVPVASTSRASADLPEVNIYFILKIFLNFLPIFSCIIISIMLFYSSETYIDFIN